MYKSSGSSAAEWRSACLKDGTGWDRKSNKAPERLCSKELHLWNMCPAPKIKPPHVTEPSAESALSSPGPRSGARPKTSSANHPRSFLVLPVPPSRRDITAMKHV